MTKARGKPEESADRGIVPDRRRYKVLGREREMRGPYDVTYRIQGQLEHLIDRRDGAVRENDGGEARRVQLEMLNLVFMEPFTQEEFEDLVPLEVTGWVADFFDDYETSSTAAASRVLEMGKRAQGNRQQHQTCLLYTSPSPRDRTRSRMPSSA